MTSPKGLSPGGLSSPSLSLPKKPTSNAPSLRQEPQPSFSPTVPGTVKEMDHTAEDDVDTRSIIQEQLSEEESRGENSGTSVAPTTSNPSQAAPKAPQEKPQEGPAQLGGTAGAPSDKVLNPSAVGARRNKTALTPVKKTLAAHSSPMSSPTVPGTEKGSGSRRPSMSVPLSRASTPALSMAVVRRETPGPASSAINLENGVAMVIGGGIIKGLSNCLMAIEEAPEEQRKGLTMELAGSVSGTLGMMGSVAEKVDEFAEKHGFRTHEYLENNATLVNLADTIRQERDKVGTRNQKIKANWSKYQRGQEFIDQYLGPNTKLGAVSCIGYLATLTESYKPIPLFKMFNFAIGSRLIEMARLKAAKKSLTGKNLFKGLTVGDVGTVFRTHKEEKLVDISYLAIPSVEDLRNLSLELDEIGLLVESGKGEALVRFDDEEEEPVFVRLNELEPVPEPESLLGQAQEEETGGSMADEDEMVIEKVNDETEADDNDREAVEDLEAGNPFEGDDPFGPGEEEHAKELREARAGKQPMGDVGTNDRPIEVDDFLELVQETSKKAITKQVGALDIKLDPATIIDGLAARELTQQALAELEQDGQDISVIVRNTANTLTVPGMVKGFKIPKAKDLQLSDDCKCRLPDSKKRLEHGDQVNLVVNSAEKWKLYPKINKLPTLGGACEFHLRQFADYMGLYSKGMALKKLQHRLSLIDKNKLSLIAYLSTNEVALWLKRDKSIEYVRKHANLGASKYLPQPITPNGRVDLSGYGGICRGLFEGESGKFKSSGAGVIKYANLKWLLCVQRGKDGNARSPLFSKIAHEFNQFEHHYRYETKSELGYALMNKVYGVIQQIARMDHGLYLGAVVSRQDGATNLVCYPEHARLLSSEREDTEPFSIVEIDMPEKQKGKRVSDRVVDYIIVSKVEDDSASPMVQFIEGSHEHPDVLMKQKGVNQRLYLFRGPGTAKKSVPTAERKLIAKCGDWKPMKVETGDAVYAKQGTYVGFNPDIGSSFRVISNNYTAVDEEGKLENGVRWSDLHEAVLDQVAPLIPRWASSQDIPLSAVPFQAYRSLTGAGALSEALLGRLKFTDRAVVSEMDALFARDQAGLEKHLTTHRGILKKMAETELQASFEDEYRQYGAKSFETYCAQLREKKEPTVPEGAPEVPPSYIQALFEDGVLRPLKSFTEPGPVREGSDDEAEVEAEEEIEEEADEASGEPVRRVRKKVLSEEYVPKGFVDLNASEINSEEVLGGSPRAEDRIPEHPMVGGPPPAEEGVRWSTDGLPPLLKPTVKRKRPAVFQEDDLASEPSPSKKSKTPKVPVQPIRHSARLSGSSSKVATTPTKATVGEAAPET
jgi:predicted DNA-binding antitoxin AbrB/MazE fold protein